jgi:phage internal scaffolding protein
MKANDPKTGDVRFDFYSPHRRSYAWIGIDEKTGEIMPSMTKQSEMEACDIHNIMKQYSPAGLQQLISENAARGQYVDLPETIDYQEALNTVIAAEAAFASLPAHVRDRFQNDPAQLLAFMANADNQEEAIKLGLANDLRKPEPPPQKVEIVNPEPVQGNRGVKGGNPPSEGA